MNAKRKTSPDICLVKSFDVALTHDAKFGIDILTITRENGTGTTEIRGECARHLNPVFEKLAYDNAVLNMLPAIVAASSSIKWLEASHAYKDLMALNNAR